MKDSEKRFLMIVYTQVNMPGNPDASNQVWVSDALNAIGNARQNAYYLDKWSNKGWYECGVSMGSGHLTELGKQEAQKLLPWWQNEQKG